MQTNNFANVLKGLSFLRLREGYPIKPFDCEDNDLNEFLLKKLRSTEINYLLPLSLLKMKNVQ